MKRGSYICRGPVWRGVIGGAYSGGYRGADSGGAIGGGLIQKGL